MTSAFSWQNSISLCPASLSTPRPNLPLDFLLLHYSPLWWKGHLFWVLILQGLVGLHRTVRLQLLQRYWSEHRLGLPWYWMVGNQQIILSFSRLHPSTAFQTLVDCDGYSISSKGFLPIVVDITVIWVKCTIPVHFSSLIPKMSTFTLAISYLITFNLPWFMDLTFQVPMQYCSLQHRTLLPSPVTSTTGGVFALAPSLHSFWSYFSTDLQQHIGHLLTWGVHLLVFYLFAFSYCSWGSQGRNTAMDCHSFPSPVDHVLSEISTMTHPSWVALYGMAHSFTELDKAVVHVLRLASFLWLWFSVCLPSDG